MCPSKPVDNCRLKTSPFVVIGNALVKVSCSKNVLLDTKLTLFVIEKYPPKFKAKAFSEFVPATSVNTGVVQFVKLFVVIPRFQAPLFN